MAGNYPLARVGDLAESISETHRKDKQCLIFLNTSDILHGKFLHRTYTAVRDWPGQAKKSIQKDDILFSEIRPANGRWAYVDEDVDDFVVSTKLMVIRARKDRLFPKFLYQFLTSSAITGWLQHLAESRSGTFPQITFDQVASLEIPLPSLSEQGAIACILGALDDKIELNRKMNRTLEAMARAIFKSWFVDFDPVRAKVESRDPSLPKEITDLFPDSFEDPELGEIPKGWKVSIVGIELTTLLGGTPSRAEPNYWEGGTIPWINSGKANEFRIIQPSEYITQVGMENSATKLLPQRTTVIAITGATLGQVSLLEIAACANQSIVGILSSKQIPSEFIYFWIKLNIGELVARQTGGAQQHINKNDVNDLKLLLPPETVMHAYYQQAKPLFDSIRNNCFKSCTLAAIRDALLPKLISGELPIPDAERIAMRCV